MNDEQTAELLAHLADIAKSLRHLANRVPPRHADLPAREGKNPFNGDVMTIHPRRRLAPWEIDDLETTATTDGD